MSSFRLERLNALLRNELNKIILKEFDFPPDLLITITRVETSSNFIQSKVYISVIPENKLNEVLMVLNKGIYDIQQIINKRLRMRPVPRIEFRKEEKTKEAGRVEEILGEIEDKKNS